MTATLNVLMAQINPKVGAIESNTQTILDIIKTHQLKTDLIVFPELAITGYPPEDLLFRKTLYQQVQHALLRIQQATQHCHVIVGHPEQKQNQRFNAASVIANQQIVSTYYKQHLPNYGVFDEMRYFTPGPATACTFELSGHTVGVCICEDLWQQGPVEQLIKAGCDVLTCINASPYAEEKVAQRENILRHHAKKGVHLLYVNQVGGQDELVFDGQSLAIDQQGHIQGRAIAFEPSLHQVTLQNNTLVSTCNPLLTQHALTYKALQCALKDYVNKNHFPGVILGLSGGIDSALTLAIAVDALGSDRVEAVLMPSQYTAEMSNEDAIKQAQTLQVACQTLPIAQTFASAKDTLMPHFKTKTPDTTEENLQARIRGLFLMALSNKHGQMVVSTSNKSETALGYATLYGDMAGGFSVLKDVLKTQVYQLAHYRNQISPVIPKRVLERPPSAELAPNQTDQDSLPEYAVIDPILTLFMEKNLSADEIINQGFEKADVELVLRRITQNEYKRRQAAPGPKITARIFGRDWRQPITSGFKD